jgi:hypothetical protein
MLTEAVGHLSGTNEWKVVSQWFIPIYKPLRFRIILLAMQICYSQAKLAMQARLIREPEWFSCRVRYCARLEIVNVMVVLECLGFWTYIMSSGIPNTRKQGVSETGSVSVPR